MRMNYFSLILCAIIFFIIHPGLPGIKAQENPSMIKGMVQNDNNQPLPGVSVIIRNTKTNFTSGTSTDNSGVSTFTRIPSGGLYSFTFSTVGYESQTLSGYNIKDNSTLSLAVKLAESASSLDQVVVIGYGTQKRKDLTGAVGSVARR